MKSVIDATNGERERAAAALRSLLDNKSAVAIPISQRPGSNALETSQQVRDTMARLKKSFPQGVEYSFVYDPTVFVRQSIEAVGLFVDDRQQRLAGSLDCLRILALARRELRIQ